MEPPFVTLDMGRLSPGEAYDLLTATIAPRPLAFVSTLSAGGVPNLAPFSFFVLGGANPPSLAFSAILNPDGTLKETLKNVFDTGEFVVNTVHRQLMEGLSRAAVRTSPDEPKWERTGLTQLASLRVRPPRIAESLVHFECRVFQVVEHGQGPGSARYVIGEVLAAHVSRELYHRGHLAGDLVLPIARMGGKAYVDTATLEMFEPESL